jgi:hypothetical protein
MLEFNGDFSGNGDGRVDLKLPFTAAWFAVGPLPAGVFRAT